MELPAYITWNVYFIFIRNYINLQKDSKFGHYLKTTS